MLNSFLEDNIIPLARFHGDILVSLYVDAEIRRIMDVLSSQKPARDEAVPNPDEWLGTSYDETDTIVLHRFFQKHADKVGKVLLSFSRMTNSHDAVAVNGKRIWNDFCDLLVEMGVALEPPTLTDKPSTEHQHYRAFMARNGHRGTDTVREIFQSTMSIKVGPSRLYFDISLHSPSPVKDQRPIFILNLSKINVETVDLELLMCHIFKVPEQS
jgi:hypothetical protein